MYFITSITRQDGAKNSRCWGYFETEAEARDAVERNVGDMYEFRYEFIVIEKVEPGLGSIGFSDDDKWGQLQWYVYLTESEKYVELENVPESCEGIISWAIG